MDELALLRPDRLYALYVHARRVRRLAYSIPFCQPIPNLHASRTIDRELDFSRGLLIVGEFKRESYTAFDGDDFPRLVGGILLLVHLSERPSFLLVSGKREVKVSGH